MFDSLSDRLGDVFDRLRRHGALSEDDVGAALREIRVALLEADVALPVVRDFEHQLLVDVEPSGGIENDDVIAFGAPGA